MHKSRRILLLLIAFSMSVAVQIYNAGQVSPLAALFTNPDGSICLPPCLFGIRPGVTSINEAKALLKSHPSLGNVREIETDRYVFPLIAIGTTMFAGKQILVRLGPGRADENPIRVTDVSLELTEPGAELGEHISSYTQLPIVTIETLIAFAGPPERVAPATFDSGQYFYFLKRGMRVHVKPRQETLGPGQGGIYQPQPEDVVTFIQVDEPLTIESLPGTKWCGFTSQIC